MPRRARHRPTAASEDRWRGGCEEWHLCKILPAGASTSERGNFANPARRIRHTASWPGCAGWAATISSQSFQDAVDSSLWMSSNNPRGEAIPYASARKVSRTNGARPAAHAASSARSGTDALCAAVPIRPIRPFRRNCSAQSGHRQAQCPPFSTRDERHQYCARRQHAE